MSQVSESETCEIQLAKRLFRQKHRWTLTSSSTDWERRRCPCRQNASSYIWTREKGGSDRAARDQDLPGCPCRVTGPGVENWRDAGGRQVLSRGQCEWKDVVVGREERKMNGA